MASDKFRDGPRALVGGGCCVFGGRDPAEGDADLGQNARVEPYARDGECGRIDRVRVHDRRQVRSRLVDGQVQKHLGGDLPVAADLMGLQVAEYERSGCHLAFRHAARRHEDAARTDPGADAPIRRGNVPPLVHPVTHLGDLASEPTLGHVVLLTLIFGRGDPTTKGREEEGAPGIF